MSLIEKAKALRKESTPMERKLWSYLRSRNFLGIKFRRQCPIGFYVADFISIEKKLIIELDGGQHNEPENQVYDLKRTLYFTELGYKVIRFWNFEIETEFDVVLDEIYRWVKGEG